LTLSVLTTIQQWLLFSGTVLAVGCVAWRWVVAPGANGRLGTSERSELATFEPRVAALGLATAGALVVAWVLRGAVQLMAFRDPFVPLAEDVDFLLFQMFWGTVWLFQGATIVLMAIAFGLARRASAAAWGAVTLLALGLVATLAMSSHAMGAETARTFWVTADAVHALAAGTWIGTLTVVLLAARPRDGTDNGAGLLAAQLRAFSPLAVVSVTALIVMGGALALDHLAGLPNLWRTSYGRILAAKVGLAGVVMLTGLWNWKRGLPSSDTPEGSAAVQRQATVEVSMALGVLLLTAVLVHSAKP